MFDKAAVLQNYDDIAGNKSELAPHMYSHTKEKTQHAGLELHDCMLHAHVVSD